MSRVDQCIMLRVYVIIIYVEVSMRAQVHTSDFTQVAATPRISCPPVFLNTDQHH